MCKVLVLGFWALGFVLTFVAHRFRTSKRKLKARDAPAADVQRESRKQVVAIVACMSCYALAILIAQDNEVLCR